MASDSFEIMRVWVSLGEHVFEGKNGWTISIPQNDQKTEEEWKIATQSAKEGWDLIAAMPITGNSLKWVGAQGVCCSYTAGYTLLFKRRIQEKVSAN